LRVLSLDYMIAQDYDVCMFWVLYSHFESGLRTHGLSNLFRLCT